MAKSVFSQPVRLLKLSCCLLLRAPPEGEDGAAEYYSVLFHCCFLLLLPSCPESPWLPPPDPCFTGHRFTFWNPDLTLAHILSPWSNICSLLPALFLHFHCPPWPSNLRNSLVLLAFVLHTLWLFLFELLKQSSWPSSNSLNITLIWGFQTCVTTEFGLDPREGSVPCRTLRKYDILYPLNAKI